MKDVYFFEPFSKDKDLGVAYNKYMALIPDGSFACLRDQDTLLLTPDAGTIITEYANNNPDAVLTCYTNRLHPLAKEQLFAGRPLGEDSLTKHFIEADSRKEFTSTTELTGPLSMLLQVIPKHIWQRVPFREGVGMLGVDTIWFRELRRAGVKILRMDGVYIWHTYRLWTDINDKTHLQ